MPEVIEPTVFKYKFSYYIELIMKKRGVEKKGDIYSEISQKLGLKYRAAVRLILTKANDSNDLRVDQLNIIKDYFEEHLPGIKISLDSLMNS